MRDHSKPKCARGRHSSTNQVCTFCGATPRHLRPNITPLGPRPRSTKDRMRDGHKAYAPYGYRTTIKKFGHLLTWKEMTGKERAVTAKRIQGSRNRNKFWKALGYPNCKLAMEARLRYRAERIARGEIDPQRARRLREVAAGEVQPIRVNEVQDAQIFVEGEIERERIRDGSRPLLGPLLVAGNYDPEYLMRREMRILDMMSRCPQ